MSIAILILICILLVIRQYISPFDITGAFPHHSAFSLFSRSFMLLIMINCIYMFGVLAGFIIFLLAFFRIIAICFLWPFTYTLYALCDKRFLIKVYILFPIGTGILSLLTVINFFVSKYMCLKEYLSGGTLTYLTVIGVISAIIGIIVFRFFIRHNTVNYFAPNINPVNK